MAKFQIIYTSCRRGIKGINDGQQIYSYNKSMETTGTDKFMSLLSYQPPLLPSGTSMSDELSLTMPASFSYRALEDDLRSCTLSTYLGRDYMGETGRFGNFISHAVAFPSREFTRYPIEYFGSNMLISSMEYEVVNSPNQPDYLPDPVLRAGELVTIDGVIDFLNRSDQGEDRHAIMKKMLAAVLTFPQTKKRVLIHDAMENIPFWIGAIAFALPLENVLEMNFTTYAFNPSLAYSQICGVLGEGSRFSLETPSVYEQNFVFDMLGNRYPDIDTEEDFLSLVEAGYSLMFDVVKDFHVFLEESSTYQGADEIIYHGYSLYQLLNYDLDFLSRHRAQGALAFQSKYGSASSENALVKLLLEGVAMLSYQLDTYSVVLEFLFSIGKRIGEENSSQLTSILFRRIVYQFFEVEREEFFDEEYAVLISSAKKAGMDVQQELMAPDIVTGLIKVIEKAPATWKSWFLFRRGVDFLVNNPRKDYYTLEHPAGQLVAAGVRHVDKETRGQMMHELPLCTFLDWKNLIDFTVLMECALSSSSVQHSGLWDATLQELAGRFAPQLYAILDYFIDKNRVDLSEQLYRASYKKLAFKDSLKLTQYMVKNHGSNQESSLVWKAFYDTKRTSLRTQERRMLFYALSAENVQVSFEEELHRGILSEISFGSLDKPQRELIADIGNCRRSKQMPPLEKLDNLLLGLVITERAESGKKADSGRHQDIIRSYTNGAGIMVESLSSKEQQEFLDWVLPSIARLSSDENELNEWMELFDFPKKILPQVFAVLAKEYIAISKQMKASAIFFRIFQYALGFGVSLEAPFGEALFETDKKHREALTEYGEKYSKENGIQKQWEAVVDYANSQNRFFRKMGKMFGEKES